MNKLALSIAVAVALGLSGCGDSLEDIKQEVGDNHEKPVSRVVFDPSNSKVSVPNDLLFLGTQDGTLTTDTGENPNYANPQVALGALDGWSTQNPYSITLEFSSGVELNETTIRPDSVRIFEVLMGDPASADEECKTVARGRACKVVSELTFGQDFVAGANGGNIAIIPLKPFKPATTYITALTSVLADNNGNTIAPSTTYELVKQDYDTAPLGSEAQKNLQQVINSYEDALAEFGVDAETVIYTAAMTTQSVGAVLTTLKQFMALPETGYAPSGLTVQDTGLTVSQLGEAFENNPLFEYVRYYRGSVNLPYYLGAATDAASATAPLTTRWTARCDSGAMIAALTDAQKAALAAELSAEQAANDAACNALSSGRLRDLGLDSARHLTKFNTIPKINSRQNVAVQMTVPDETVIAKPAAGWPVIILQHGITSKKEDMLAITGTLSARGFATIAIDHPLHGSRGFANDVTIDGTTKTVTVNASTNSATDYMNLSNLLVTRDNLRQSIADTLALRLALNSLQNVDLDLTNVQFLGHSLGAITGTSMVALANTPVGVEDIDNLYALKSATLAMPGGAVANFLFDSGAFGPLIKSSLILGAGGTVAEQYVAFAAANAGCGGTATPPFAACFELFMQDLAQRGETATITQISTTLTQFAFAAQTVTDSGDPNNYAERFVNSDTPAYIIEVVGNDDNLADQVIPNGFANPLAALAAGKMPLAGTEPLARLLQAVNIPNTAGNINLQGNNAIARFTEGSHSSILSPAASQAATVEMQTETVTFFMTQGAGLVVANPAVLAEMN